MKKISIYVVLLIVTGALWSGAISLFADRSGVEVNALVSEGTFVAIGSLFSVLALMTMLYLLVLLSLEVKSNRAEVEKIAFSNKCHLEITALTALIQECDATLYRYDRWEEAGIKGDYMNAKTSVRDKMNAYRLKLEQTYEEIE
ncbi:MAG TPA: hypothetical protein ENJ08_20635 [Gammaproteobacteria bacterium]|nr:hypothetical protein [Gammaproteobacteria bacterium]